MSLKATINKIPAFDAKNDYTFQFSYGGNQPYYNELIIYDGSTNAVVYDQLIETMSLSHTVKADTLTNDRTYYAVVLLYDINQTASELSDNYYFTCYDTPVITVSNLNEDGSTKVNNSHCDVMVDYFQANQRALREYRYTIYDSGRRDIFYRSDTLYYNAGIQGSIACPVKSLENNSVYYFQFEGITIDHVEVATALIEFHVAYHRTNSYAVMNVECDRNAGCMKYSTHIVIVDGHSTGSIELNNGVLKIADGVVKYDTGFNITNDFILGVQFSRLSEMCLTNGSDRIVLRRLSYENSEYYKLEISNSGLPCMILYSPLITAKHDNHTAYIKRMNGLYRLKIITDSSGGDQRDNS